MKKNINNKTPYLEVSIVETQGDREEILKILENKARMSKEAVIFIKDNVNNPIIRIEYPSKETLLKVYSRDEFVYESAVKLLNSGIISPAKVKTAIENGTSKSDKLFLILKYKTNFKSPILKNYRFTYKIAELLGLSMSYEEVEDGFILFYKTKEDFEIGRIDLTKFQEVKKRLEERGIWRKEYEYLWNH
ncbi:MAG: hypothetical protein DRO88_12130 [Promethearchaeia archaeon]|nr:MAG: hypothetical protein DRO88_12130 [Candidatus Lokiarchaeia archaeon]